MNETEFITRFLQSQQSHDPTIALGIGDDAAVIDVPPGQQLIITTDSLLADIHFFRDQDPESIAHKALNVNLSDLAAMAAVPKWLTLNLSLPEFDQNWMTRFSQKLFQSLQAANVSLIGGDLCRGPMAVSFTALGLVPSSQYITRAGAKCGDDIFVSGYLGDAALALSLEREQLEQDQYRPVKEKLFYPTARNQLGYALGEYVNSMIDISDGLYQDLERIIVASGCGAEIQAARIPLSESMQQHCEPQQAQKTALRGGDDYELCFTVKPQYRKQIDQLSDEFTIPINCIGKVTDSKEITVFDSKQDILKDNFSGYDHLSSTASLVIS